MEELLITCPKFGECFAFPLCGFVVEDNTGWAVPPASARRPLTKFLWANFAKKAGGYQQTEEGCCGIDHLIDVSLS